MTPDQNQEPRLPLGEDGYPVLAGQSTNEPSMPRMGSDFTAFEDHTYQVAAQQAKDKANQPSVFSKQYWSTFGANPNMWWNTWSNATYHMMNKPQVDPTWSAPQPGSPEWKQLDKLPDSAKTNILADSDSPSEFHDRVSEATIALANAQKFDQLGTSAKFLGFAADATDPSNFAMMLIPDVGPFLTAGKLIRTAATFAQGAAESAVFRGVENYGNDLYDGNDYSRDIMLGAVLRGGFRAAGDTWTTFRGKPLEVRKLPWESNPAYPAGPDMRFWKQDVPNGFDISLNGPRGPRATPPSGPEAPPAQQLGGPAPVRPEPTASGPPKGVWAPVMSSVERDRDEQKAAPLSPLGQLQDARTEALRDYQEASTTRDTKAQQAAIKKLQAIETEIDKFGPAAEPPTVHPTALPPAPPVVGGPVHPPAPPTLYPPRSREDVLKQMADANTSGDGEAFLKARDELKQHDETAAQEPEDDGPLLQTSKPDPTDKAIEDAKKKLTIDQINDLIDAGREGLPPGLPPALLEDADRARLSEEIQDAHANAWYERQAAEQETDRALAEHEQQLMHDNPPDVPAPGTEKFPHEDQRTPAQVVLQVIKREAESTGAKVDVKAVVKELEKAGHTEADLEQAVEELGAKVHEAPEPPKVEGATKAPEPEGVKVGEKIVSEVSHDKLTTREEDLQALEKNREAAKAETHEERTAGLPPTKAEQLRAQLEEAKAKILNTTKVPETNISEAASEAELKAADKELMDRLATEKEAKATKQQSKDFDAKEAQDWHDNAKAALEKAQAALEKNRNAATIRGVKRATQEFENAKENLKYYVKTPKVPKAGGTAKPKGLKAFDFPEDLREPDFHISDEDLNSALQDLDEHAASLDQNPHAPILRPGPEGLSPRGWIQHGPFWGGDVRPEPIEDQRAAGKTLSDKYPTGTSAWATDVLQDILGSVKQGSWTHKIASKLVQHLEDIPIHFVDRDDPILEGSGGMYFQANPEEFAGFLKSGEDPMKWRQGKDAIFISAAMNDVRKSRIVLHEMVHAVTNRLIWHNPNHPAVKELQRVMDRAKQAWAERYGPDSHTKVYGFTNLDEFATESMTGPEMAHFLMSVADEGKKPLLVRFAVSMARLLGFSVKEATNPSLYHSFISAFDDVAANQHSLGGKDYYRYFDRAAGGWTDQQGNFEPVAADKAPARDGYFDATNEAHRESFEDNRIAWNENLEHGDTRFIKKLDAPGMRNPETGHLTQEGALAVRHLFPDAEGAMIDMPGGQSAEMTFNRVAARAQEPFVDMNYNKETKEEYAAVSGAVRKYTTTPGTYNAHEILDEAIQHATPGSWLHELTTKLRQRIDNIPIHVQKTFQFPLEDGRPAAGAYSVQDHAIKIGYANDAQIMFHEMIHAVTSRFMLENPNHPMVKEMERLAKYTKDHIDAFNAVKEKAAQQAEGIGNDARAQALRKQMINKNVGYGATNAREFLAEGMTRGAFQDILGRLKHPDGASAGSAWTKFVGLVRKAVGLSPIKRNDDMLSHVMASFDSISQKPATWRGQSGAFDLNAFKASQRAQAAQAILRMRTPQNPGPPIQEPAPPTWQADQRDIPQEYEQPWQKVDGLGITRNYAVEARGAGLTAVARNAWGKIVGSIAAIPGQGALRNSATDHAQALAAGFARNVGRIHDNYKSAWMTERGYGSWRRMLPQVDAQWGQDVFHEIHGIDSGSPAAKTAAAELRQHYDQVGAEANRLQIKGFENLNLGKDYFPRKFDSTRIEDMTKRLGTPFMEKLWADAMERSGGYPGLGRQDLETIAAGYQKRLMETFSGIDVFTAHGFNPSDLDLMRRLMANVPGAQQTITRLEQLHNANSQGAVRYGKSRLTVDENHQFTDPGTGQQMRLFDMYDKDAFGITRRYSKVMAGVIGLGRSGVKSEDDFNRLMSTARQSLHDSGMESTQLDRREAAVMSVYKHLLGRPLSDDEASQFQQLGRLARTLTSAASMGLSGFSVFNNVTRVMSGRYLKYMAQHFPEVVDSFRKNADGTYRSGLMEQLSRVLDTGWDHVSEDIFNQHDWNTWMGKAQYVANRLNQATMNVSGMAPSLISAKRVAALELHYRIRDNLSSTANDMSENMWRRLGIDQDMGQRINTELQARPADNPNFGGWKDTGARDAYLNGIHYEANTLIHGDDIASQADWMNKGIGQYIAHLRRFPLMAMNKQLNRLMAQGDTEAMMDVATTAATGWAAYRARTYVQSLGMNDKQREDFFNRRLAAGAQISALVGRSPYAGIFPNLIDTAATLTGAPGFFDNVSSREASRSMLSPDSIPVLSEAAKVAGFIKNAVQASRGQFTQRSMKNLVQSSPLGTTVPLNTMSNWMSQYLPQKAPKSIRTHNENDNLPLMDQWLDD